MDLQPRLMTREQAAAYCGYSPEHFSRQVAAGRLPKPLPGMKRWDRQAIDHALDTLSGISSARASPEDEYAAWEAEWREKEAARPVHSLNKRQEQALRHLVVRGETNGSDVRGASTATFESLVAQGFAATTASGWSSTAAGTRLVKQLDEWEETRRSRRIAS